MFRYEIRTINNKYSNPNFLNTFLKYNSKKKNAFKIFNLIFSLVMLYIL